MCNNSCNECPRKIYSAGVSVQTIDTVNTLVIDIPQQSFTNCQRGCIVITQNLPETATIYMPVVISIGGVVTTVYPLVSCDCSPVTACAIRTRKRYPFKVSINGADAVFKILRNLSCAPQNDISTIPVVTTEGG